MSHRASSVVIVLLTVIFIVPSSAEWLEFGAGCPDNSDPLTFHNITLDDLISFEVELQGLLADSVEHEGISYLRFDSSPGTVPMDETGFPEVPVVTCFVAVPDDSDLDLMFSAGCMSSIECLPVYPAPLDSLVVDSTCTPYIGEFFRKDSAAYASDEWYPAELATISGEFMLREQRVAVVNVHPVQYLASEDSLRVWSDIGLSINFTGADPVWTDRDLGPYERIIGDRLLGYEPLPGPWHPIDPAVYRPTDLVNGPPIVPDYVIIVASGLDGRKVDQLAQHRVDLNDFNVVIATTDDIYSQFNQGALHLTPGVIRNFTEAMWDWHPEANRRPSYMLLIGDHEEVDFEDEDWFLPVFESEEDEYGNCFCNDEWYVCFGNDREEFTGFPDMMVGRLPARKTKDLIDMIDVIIDYETGGIPPELEDNRRHITRLAGTEDDGSVENGIDDWEPTFTWTTELADWLHYDLDNYYCGDGDPYTEEDGSTMSSRDWVAACTDVLSRGSQVAFYTDHGDFHMFSAGLETDPFSGVPDSCFDDDDVRRLCMLGEEHWPPFMLLLCCTAGTFNHTESRHPEGNAFHLLCQDPDHRPPKYDFDTDCMGEDFILNTRGGSIGVLCGSLSSNALKYEYYGKGILDAVFHQGVTRTGDALAYSRIMNLDHFWLGDGFETELSQFNLLGDPAVDLGDGVQYPDCCDLIISPTDLEVNRYPTMSVDSNGEIVFMVTVRNAGWLDAGSFDVTLRITDENDNEETLVTECTGLGAREETSLEFVWDSHIWFTPPGTLFLTASAADPGGQTPDSWIHNNSADTQVDILDLYPNDGDWPAALPGSVKSPPLLANLDSDPELEIVALSGLIICAYDSEDPSEPLWIAGPYALSPDHVNIETPVVTEGYTIPAAGDMTGDGIAEIVVDTREELLVLRGSDGAEIASYSHSVLGSEWEDHPHAVVLADMYPDGVNDSVDEIAVQWGDELRILDYEDGTLQVLDTETIPVAVTAGNNFGWIVASDIKGDGHMELIVSATGEGSFPYLRNSAVYLYDHASGGFYSQEEWDGENLLGIPSAGSLPASGLRVALSRQYSDASQGLDPAVLLNPDSLSQSTPCEPSTVEDSEHVLCCIMADWFPPYGQPDRVLANAEDQCFGWYQNGQPTIGYPIQYTGFEGTALPPFPALGELDDQDDYDYADFLVATREGSIVAFHDEGYPLDDLGFPYTLPSLVYGGFAIADIDRDGKVEVVFGTMDNYLHVWELGDCTAGYAPWPQCQHDAARTGVLLEE